jgi:hypothetical protein
VSDNRAGARSTIVGSPLLTAVASACCGRPMSRQVDAENAGEFFCCSACGVGFYFHF